MARSPKSSALRATNSEAYAGYELDEWCERAGALIKGGGCVPDAAVHYIVGGTQANVAIIAHALRPWRASCADCGISMFTRRAQPSISATNAKQFPRATASLSLPICAPLPRVMQKAPCRACHGAAHGIYLVPSESGRSIRSQNSEALRAVCDNLACTCSSTARLAYGLAFAASVMT